MRRNLRFYMVSIGLMGLVFLFFSNRYRQLTRYSKLEASYNSILSQFQNLSGQIDNAAMITPELIKARNASNEAELFFADSASVIQQLEKLKSMVSDPVNIRTVNKLDDSIRSQLSWLLNSNVRDSIIANKSPEHIAALKNIHLIIKQGIQEINRMISLEEKQLESATNSVKMWMIFLIVLSGIIITYITSNLSKQKATTKTKELTLERQQALLASIVKTSGDAIIGKTFDSVVTSWNNSAERIFGYTANEMIGQSIIKIIPDNLLNEETEFIERIKKGERVKNYETQRLTKDGKLLDLSLTISPIINAEGKITGVSKIAHDITERKKTEAKILNLNQELLKSETRFRGLIENSHDIVALLDENSRLIYRSPSSYKITGWTNEEMERIDNSELIHPDDRLLVKTFAAKVFSTPGESFSITFRSRHKAGHYIWLEGIMTNMLHDESLKGVVANFKDITDKKRAEEELTKSEKIYKTIASGIPGSVICLLDADYRYLLIEGDMLEKLGYSKNELLGNKAEDVLPPEIFKEIEEEFKTVFEGKNVTRETSRSGYDTISKFIPLKDEKNVVYAIMTVALDVTKLKNAQRHIAELNRGLEEKIAQRTEQLKKSNEELEAFSYSISHDLRTPLRAINGYAKMLEEDYYELFDDEGKRLLAVVQENAKKMGMLIDDLLSFSKLGRKEIYKSDVNMKLLTENTIEELNRSIPNKAEIKIDHLHPATADSSLINQVMANLISNAIKYSSERERSLVEIKSEKKNGELIYSVSDNGVGFNMQYVHKLFGVFQRLHTEEEFEGTGVGLAIVQRIITKHGGRVWAEGEQGKGATFYFSLPDYETIKNN